uniref:Uncharacterized protein n=1 Tax=Aegilops tauschii subsp. strangulata TaxID=200361 RepID=A0A453F705_AEGTS
MSYWRSCVEPPRILLKILSVELWHWWSLKLDTDNSCFSKHLLHEGKHWFSELCSCSITSAPVLQHSWLATMAAPLCRRMRKMGIGLHLIQFEQLLLFDKASINDQWQLDYDKHDVVCAIPRHEISQGAIQIMSMTVHWPFFNQTKLKGSGQLDKQCNSDQITNGSRARIQLTVLNHGLFSHTTYSQQHGIFLLQFVPVLCKMMSASETRSLISLWSHHILLDYMFEQSICHDWESLFYSNQRTPLADFGMVDSSSARMGIPIISQVVSKHHCVFPICAIIQTDSDQCKREWHPQCFLNKWLEEVGNGQNKTDFVPLCCYAWGLLNPNCYQVSMNSCFHGYSFLYGLVLLQWEIAWTLHLEFSSGGNNSGQPFRPPSTTCAKSTGKQEINQGRRGDRADVGYVCCIYYTCYSDQDPGGHNNYPDTFHRQASVEHDYYLCGVEVFINYDYHRDYDQAKQHRVQWDPGGSRWHRLGVKPNLKEGRMLGAHLTCMGLPRLAHGPGLVENPSDYKYARGSN